MYAKQCEFKSDNPKKPTIELSKKSEDSEGWHREEDSRPSTAQGDK